MERRSGAAGMRHAPGHARALLAAALLAVAAGGCGQAEVGPREKAESAVAALLAACAREDGEAALALLTPPTRTELIGAESVVAGCERVLGLRGDAVPEGLAPTVFRDATVASVEVHAGFGTATVRAAGGETSELELESPGGRWLVANPPD